MNLPDAGSGAGLLLGALHFVNTLLLLGERVSKPACASWHAGLTAVGLSVERGKDGF